ncbi:tudor domain-containing protein 1 [Archocentrus centrarchus]|uniref:tudor domain-containing protein 1 n=1 Tax=Archocentrus centrarchus TaxID=63155 RepID=UPI0011E9D199|nr:tudor domain-containing protein 1 [Archocentrus centrarchus]
MNRSFFSNVVRPNLPLRKPSSSPAGFSATLPPQRQHSMPVARALRSAPGSFGEGPINSTVKREKFALLGSGPPSLTVNFCNYCGQQGIFCCKRCKKVFYCSAACQTEDWKAHRHVCKFVDPEAVKGKPKETSAVPATGDKSSLGGLKHGDSCSLQRVYFKDLHVTKIIKGTDIQATVVEFYSPSRFFLLPQSPEVLEALRSINTELQKTYSSFSVATYVPCVGEICAVQFSCDMNWYRGLVQTLAPDQKTANILYIDFGNEENVPVDRIRGLTANIKPVCPCAMECCIIGVVPVVGNWSGECCIAVRQLLAGKIVTVRLVETVDGRIHAVDILLSMGKELSAFLLEHGYAVKEPVNTTPTKQDINAMVNASLENFKCLSDGKDDNTWAQPPEPLTQAVGDKVSVVVTHFQSPDELIVQKVDNAGVIQDLQLKLREHCSQVAAPQNFRPAPGTVCCAQFSEDKQWYRATVLAYSSKERVCVGYLDFGNSKEVALDHLRPISTSLLALPMQAMPCGLAGVQPVGESWSEECLLALQRRVSNRILHIEIQGAHEAKALVTMIDEASDPQANIAELLISAGYAAPCPVTTNNESAAIAEAQVCEPLVWSYTELPCNGQTVALLASVVENPGAFYCRIDSPAEHQRLKELGAQLKQHCEADASPFEPKVGEPCCALLSDDGAWYRAMVKGLSDDQVAVNFVDYGYSLTVEKGHLRSITPQLLTLPFQAVCCWLAGVEPLGSEWSSEAVLWFQTQVDGEHLSARVLSLTEQGYGVELQSRGVNVTATLISEQLAKVPEETAKENHGETCSATKQIEKKNEQGHSCTQVSNQTEVIFKEMPPEGQTAVATEVPSFPVEWKTVELPLSDTFQPYFAGIISPSLFYLLGPTQVDQQKLQGVVVELAAYCSNSQATLSSAVKSRPAPGAACCAQFSADNNWYRAVILEVDENEVSVLYADYGNSEKVPLSRILPIPACLLQLPFQIIRCTLAGKEHFPAEWPQEVQQMFQTVLISGVLATVQYFDGSASVLSLVLPAEKGGGNITEMILEALHAQTKRNPCTTPTQKTDEGGSSTTISTAAAPDSSKSKPIPENQKGPIGTETLDPTAEHLEQKEDISAASVSGLQTSSCCCQSLKAKIDELEVLMKLQLSLMKMLAGQKK